MTKQEAKALALEKLCCYDMQPNFYYRRHEYLPDRIQEKTKHLHNYCPLCELFCVPNPENGKHCGGCPLTPPSCNDVSDEALEDNILRLKAWMRGET